MPSIDDVKKLVSTNQSVADTAVLTPEELEQIATIVIADITSRGLGFLATAGKKAEEVKKFVNEHDGDTITELVAAVGGDSRLMKGIPQAALDILEAKIEEAKQSQPIIGVETLVIREEIREDFVKGFSAVEAERATIEKNAQAFAAEAETGITVEHYAKAAAITLGGAFDGKTISGASMAEVGIQQTVEKIASQEMPLDKMQRYVNAEIDRLVPAEQQAAAKTALQAELTALGETTTLTEALNTINNSAYAQANNITLTASKDIIPLSLEAAKTAQLNVTQISDGGIGELASHVLTSNTDLNAYQKTAISAGVTNALATRDPQPTVDDVLKQTQELANNPQLIKLTKEQAQAMYDSMATENGLTGTTQFTAGTTADIVMTQIEALAQTAGKAIQAWPTDVTIDRSLNEDAKTIIENQQVDENGKKDLDFEDMLKKIVENMTKNSDNPLMAIIALVLNQVMDGGALGNLFGGGKEQEHAARDPNAMADPALYALQRDFAEIGKDITGMKSAKTNTDKGDKRGDNYTADLLGYTDEQRNIPTVTQRIDQVQDLTKTVHAKLGEMSLAMTQGRVEDVIRLSGVASEKLGELEAFIPDTGSGKNPKINKTLEALKERVGIIHDAAELSRRDEQAMGAAVVGQAQKAAVLNAIDETTEKLGENAGKTAFLKAFKATNQDAFAQLTPAQTTELTELIDGLDKNKADLSEVAHDMRRIVTQDVQVGVTLIDVPGQENDVVQITLVQGDERQVIMLDGQEGRPVLNVDEYGVIQDNVTLTLGDNDTISFDQDNTLLQMGYALDHHFATNLTANISDITAGSITATPAATEPATVTTTASNDFDALLKNDTVFATAFQSVVQSFAPDAPTMTVEDKGSSYDFTQANVTAGADRGEVVHSK